MTDFSALEHERRQLLASRDAARTLIERNRLGQFATPPALAAEIVSAAVSLLPEGMPIRYLEPGFGTGAFYSALRNSAPGSRVETAAGYEVDPHYGEAARRLWADTGLDLRIADFTAAPPPARDREAYNLVVCNPPYVRHHHLTRDQKRRLHAAVAGHVGYDLSGLAGLYCYFLLLSRAWMSPGGVAAWLVPSEFMDVNYGLAVKRFLLERVSLLRIHRFDPKEVQFGDALVSSAVVFFRNAAPDEDREVEFSFGGTIRAPKLAESVPAASLRTYPKWTGLPHRVPEVREAGETLADLFRIKRGLATGCNGFFVLTPEQVAGHGIPHAHLRPILPSPRDLETEEVLADEGGIPRLRHRRFLIDCKLPEGEVREKHPALWAYLRGGVEQGIDRRYLCRHRDPWYSQEDRPPAPFLCTYMGRPTKRSEVPFRFILNRSKATAANVYLLLYPKPGLLALLDADPALYRAVWLGLSSIGAEMMKGEGRIYGGGMHKIEPKELANVPAEVILGRLPGGAGKTGRQTFLFR